MIHISDYIEEHHNGNKSEFARIQGVKRQHVQYWCKGEYYVHDDKLFHLTQPITKQTTDEDTK